MNFEQVMIFLDIRTAVFQKKLYIFADVCGAKIATEQSL